MSEDPIGLGDGANLYAYMSNSPVLHVDLLGLTKGGPQNINVIHQGEVLTKRSSLQTIQNAIKDAIRNNMSAKHIKALKGLEKVVKRGGKFGVLGPLCIVYDCVELYKDFDCILRSFAPECQQRRWDQCCAVGNCI